MKNSRLLAALLLCIFPVFTIAQSSQSTSSVPAEKIGKEIDILGERYLELGRFSGNILVAENGKILYQQDFGKASYELNRAFNSNTTFKAGDLSRLFTKAILLQMASEKEIDLEKKVSEYLPEVEKDFSVRQVMEHEAGLATIEAVRQQHPGVAYAPIAFTNLSEAGEQQESDLGYNLLGLLLENVSGKTYSELINGLSEKIQLKNTFFEAPAGAEIAGGYTYTYVNNEVKVKASEAYKLNEAFSSNGIKTTAPDLLKLLNHLPEEEISIDGYLENDGFSYGVYKAAPRIVVA